MHRFDDPSTVVYAMVGAPDASEASAHARLRLTASSLRVEPDDPSLAAFEIPFDSIVTVDAIGPEREGWQEVEISLAWRARRRIVWPAYFTSQVTDALRDSREPMVSVRTDPDQTATVEEASTVPVGGVADQVRLLVEMLNAGALTVDEFEALRIRTVASAIPPDPLHLQQTVALYLCAAMYALNAVAYVDRYTMIFSVALSAALGAIFLLALAVRSQFSSWEILYGIAAVPLVASKWIPSLSSTVERRPEELRGWLLTGVWLLGQGWFLLTVLRRGMNRRTDFIISLWDIILALGVGGTMIASILLIKNDATRAASEVERTVGWVFWTNLIAVGLILALTTLASRSHHDSSVRLAWGCGTTIALVLSTVSFVSYTKAGLGYGPLAALTVGCLLSLYATVSGSGASDSGTAYSWME